MKSFETYKNHEAMNAASEEMRTQFIQFEFDNVPYTDIRVKNLANLVLTSCVPQLEYFLHARVVAEANTAYRADNTHPEDPVDESIHPFEGLHVEGLLRHIEFQPIEKTVENERTNGLILMADYDFHAVIRPQYVDPEPGDIVFGDEVLVPFASTTLFEPVNS